MALRFFSFRFLMNAVATSCLVCTERSYSLRPKFGSPPSPFHVWIALSKEVKARPSSSKRGMHCSDLDRASASGPIAITHLVTSVMLTKFFAVATMPSAYLPRLIMICSVLALRKGTIRPTALVMR
eukprot:7986908-Pyramimonas_sp.AAC.1